MTFPRRCFVASGPEADHLLDESRRSRAAVVFPDASHAQPGQPASAHRLWKELLKGENNSTVPTMEGVTV